MAFIDNMRSAFRSTWTDRKHHFPDQVIHFLHISKNAGTQIQHMANELNHTNNTSVLFHKHNIRLHDLPRSERYFFSIRNPESRFYSGFYSRKRKGAPRHFSEWSEHEARAFSDFDHANDLAEAISDDGVMGERAIKALETIIHTTQMQIDWFDHEGYFLDVRPPIHIIRQERFNEDFKAFAGKLGIAQVPVPTADPVAAHKNDYEATPVLSDKARTNIRQWYYQDFRFYDMCVRWLESGSAADRPE